MTGSVTSVVSPTSRIRQKSTSAPIGAAWKENQESITESLTDTTTDRPGHGGVALPLNTKLFPRISSGTAPTTGTTGTAPRPPGTSARRPPSPQTPPSYASIRPSSASTRPSSASTRPSSASTRPSSASTRPSFASTRPSSAYTRPSSAYTRPSSASVRRTLHPIDVLSASYRRPHIQQTSFLPPLDVLLAAKDVPKPPLDIQHEKFILFLPSIVVIFGNNLIKI